jgi:predicted GNAT superfamily acetyltransferase
MRLNRTAKELRERPKQTEEISRAKYRQQQRCVIMALLNEGLSVSDVRREHPRLDWTLEELEALAESVLAMPM